MLKSVEDVFEKIGGFSTYQRWITFALVFPQIPMAMIALSPNFTGSNKVQLLCDKKLYVHESAMDTCEANINCTYSPVDFQYTSIVQEWDLVCSKSWVADTITSCFMVGMVLGVLCSSIFADLFGRKKCYFMQMLCMGIFGILPSFTNDPWTYAISRLMAGFGVGGCFAVLPAYHMEFLTPSWRTIVGTISLWPLGEMLLGLTAYLIRDWRILTISTAFPALLLIPLYPTILESPRWLFSQNRPEEAHKVIKKMCKWNSKPSPSLEEIKELQHHILSKQNSCNLTKLEVFKRVLSNKRLQIDLAIETFCVVTCTVFYYGVSFSAKSLGGNPYMNMVYMGILDVISSPVSNLTNNGIGRKKTFILYMAAGTLFTFGNIFLETWPWDEDTYRHVIPTAGVVLSLCGRFAVTAAWGSLRVIVLETAPTDLRVSCMGFTEIAGNLGGVLSPQLVLLGTISSPLPYIILGTLTICASISSWFLSDTTEIPLEDRICGNDNNNSVEEL